MNLNTLRSTGARITAVAVLACASAGATAGSATADDPGKTPDVRAKTMATELTPEQAAELRKQWESGRKLEPLQALKAAGLQRSDLQPAQAPTTGGGADEGEATVALDCSEMTLWGDSDGNWTWSNHFWKRDPGPAEFGRGTVTTNGLGSTSNSFNISGNDQLEGDQLFSAGIWPTATEMNAWSVNANHLGDLTFCIGFVRAAYE
ncbi:hypothetical protein MU582_09650 [Nocardioidaceae bacterium SCSIO 66511]|nr:hypothetical protein MU582_09650 [Nocardioidaceae bacterium SCSIO 66511]